MRSKYVITERESGMRLCMDNKWRHFAPFGTCNFCVKIYRNHGAAGNKARRIGGEVFELKAGYSMDASGRVMEVAA